MCDLIYNSYDIRYGLYYTRYNASATLLHTHCILHTMHVPRSSLN